MGSTRKKFMKRHGREPSDEELDAFRRELEKEAEEKKSAADKEAAKAAKKLAKQAAAAGSSAAPAAAASAADAPAAAPSSGSKAGSVSKAQGKRPRTDPAGDDEVGHLAEMVGQPLASGMVGMRSAAASKKPKAGGLSEAAFREVWSKQLAGARTLLSSFEEAVTSRAGKQDKLLDEYRKKLSLALTEVDDVIERCRSKHAAAEAAAAAKRAAKAATRAPKPQKEHALDVKLRDEALDILSKFQYDVLTACEGAAKNGYLSTDHLKHLCIHKGVYSAIANSSANPPNRVMMMNKLVKAESFVQEAAAAAAAADQQSSDDSDS